MKFKKLLALLMAASMLVSSFVACSKEGEDETDDASQDIASDEGGSGINFDELVDIPSSETQGSGNNGGNGTNKKPVDNNGADTNKNIDTGAELALPPKFEPGDTVIKGISSKSYDSLFRGKSIRFYAAETWGHAYQLHNKDQFYWIMNEKYKLKTEVLPSIFGSDVLKNLNEINSGNQIDIIGYGHEKIPSVYNICQPINGYLDMAKLKASKDVDHELMEFTRKKNDYYFLPSLLREVIFYNVKMFKDKNQPEPFDLLKQGKWDWDHFETIGKNFVSKGSGGKYDKQFLAIWEKTYYEFALTNNAAIYKYDNQGKVTLTITEPNCKQALEYVHRLYADLGILKDFPAGGGYSFFSSKFTVPMIKIANTRVNGVKLGFVPMPKGPKGENINTSMGIGYGLPKKQKYPKNSKMALTFVDLLNQANNRLEKESYLRDTENPRAEEMYNKTILGTKSAVMVLYGVGKASEYLQPITEAITSAKPGQLAKSIEQQKGALQLEADRVWHLSE